MNKTITKSMTLVSSFIFPLAVHAANKPIYQVTYQMSEKGKVVGSMQMTIEEGQVGEVNAGAEPNPGSDSLAVTVKSAPNQKLSVDYRFKNSKDGKSFELAKTAVIMSPGSSETNDFKDSSGHDFQLKITVKKM